MSQQLWNNWFTIFSWDSFGNTYQNHHHQMCLLDQNNARISNWPQFGSLSQLCPTLCDLLDCSMTVIPVLHYQLELTQTHVHWVSHVTQPSHPLLSPSPLAPNPSQHRSLFQWVNSLHEVAKILESLSNFQIHNRVLLTAVTMLCLRSLGLSSWESVPLTSFTHFLHAHHPPTLSTTNLSSVSMSCVAFFRFYL